LSNVWEVPWFCGSTPKRGEGVNWRPWSSYNEGKKQLHEVNDEKTTWPDLAIWARVGDEETYFCSSRNRSAPGDLSTLLKAQVANGMCSSLQNIPARLTCPSYPQIQTCSIRSARPRGHGL
jgi:hypothetical protein